MQDNDNADYQKNKDSDGNETNMGRPRKKFDYEHLERILSKYPLVEIEVAELMGVSTWTLEQRIKEKYNMTFLDLKKRKATNIKTRLINKAYDLALNQNNGQMLKFCLTNLAGWSERVENKITESEIKIVIDSEDADL